MENKPMTISEMGRKGGLSRARKLTRKRRIEIANMGAKAAKMAGKTGGRPKKISVKQ